MSEQSADEARLMMASAPVGPDTLRLPGMPSHLTSALAQLDQLTQGLQEAGTALKAADPQAPGSGRTVRAVSRVAQRAGLTLEDDVQRLQELAEVVTAQRDQLRDAQQGLLPDLRQRWQQARAELREAVQAENARQDQLQQRWEDRQREEREERQERQRWRDRDDDRGGRGARLERADDRPEVAAQRVQPPDLHPMQVIHHVDDGLVEEHEHVFRELFGSVFRDPGPGGGLGLQDRPELQDAVQRYRQVVRQVLADYAETAQRINALDDDLDQRLPRPDRPVLAAAPAQPAGGAEEPDTVSAPRDIRRLADELAQGAQALDALGSLLPDIRLAIRSGRLRPEDGRIGSMNGFQADWSAHLDDLRQRLRGAHEAAGTVAQRMRQLDEDGAAEVREAGRAEG